MCSQVRNSKVDVRMRGILSTLLLYNSIYLLHMYILKESEGYRLLFEMWAKGALSIFIITVVQNT